MPEQLDTINPFRQSDIDVLNRQLILDQRFEPRSPYPVTSNWASQLAHPCERYLYHNRMDWEEKIQRDWKGIGERGELIHSWWKQRMMAKGYEITHTEVQLSQKLRDIYKIGGKIDGKIRLSRLPRKTYEFKSMNPHEYERINTYEDIAESRREYVRMYIGQLQIYLLDNNEESGLFILCNALTLEWKTIIVYLDLGYCEWLLQRAERINKAVETATPPERIPYGQTCRRCDFANVCLPDIRNEGLEMVDEDHLLEILAKRRELEEAHQKWVALDREAKDLAKVYDRDFILSDKYKVEIQKTTYKRLDTKRVPIELRSLYEVETNMTRVEFIPLDGRV